LSSLHKVYEMNMYCGSYDCPCCFILNLIQFLYWMFMLKLLTQISFLCIPIIVYPIYVKPVLNFMQFLKNGLLNKKISA
jgi:hypothetical protein